MNRCGKRGTRGRWAAIPSWPAASFRFSTNGSCRTSAQLRATTGARGPGRWRFRHGALAGPTILGAALLAAGPAPAAVVLENGVSACTISTRAYRLRVDTTSPGWWRLAGRAGRPLARGIGEVVVEAGGNRYTSSGRPAPHLHTLRSGPYLVELALENVTLAAGGEVWPGLVEMRLTCHEEALFVHARFLIPGGEWVNAGRFVYRRPRGHPVAPVSRVTRVGLLLGLDSARPAGGTAGWLAGDRPALGLRATPPGREALTQRSGGLWLDVPSGSDPWPPDSVREAAVAMVVGATRAAARERLAVEASSLPASAFQVVKGGLLGYDPHTGLYTFRAQTSPTPDPPRGVRGGTHFTVTNDGRPRTLLIDSWDPWGGICGGMVCDVAGRPQPVVAQFGLNFPELHTEAGEPGWATLTFPLRLAPHERRSLRVEHLFGSATDRGLMYLTSLENVGDPLLLQTTVGRGESHTLTTGPYPGALKPGNELRLNDFRRIYHQMAVRSVSAILPTLFGYTDSRGRYQGLMPGAVRFRETGPFLVEYTVAARTPDGRVAGMVRVWQAAHSDMTRVFTEVDLRALGSVALLGAQAAPLFFVRHHASNPMAYSRCAFQGAQGVQVAEMNYVPHVVANGAPLGDLPFGALFRADNPLDQGIPCSDTAGNPGWVLLAWDVRLGRERIQPGAYAFTTGANDREHGDYARDMAVVPERRVAVIPAGSTFRYRAMHLVAGTSRDDERLFVAERAAWALHPLAVEATTGRVVSTHPPEVMATGGRALFSLSGGKDRVPVRVGGLRADRAVRAWVGTPAGERELHAGTPGEA